MRSHVTWSVSLGRWGGVHVRLHMFFLLFALFTLFLGWQAAGGNQGEQEFVSIAGGSVVILLASVLLHELGHYMAAIRLGGAGDEIVLGPLGGLRPMRPPFDPLAECLVHLAGPLVNLALCVAASAVLFAMQEDVWALLSPLAPQGLVEGDLVLRIVKLTFWINWLLALVNLTPAFPFDGGRALRAGLLGFWPDASPARATHIVTTTAKVLAAGLLVLAWVWFRAADPATQVVPLWFCLVSLAIFLFFSAKQEEERSAAVQHVEPMMEDKYPDGYSGLESGETHRADPGGPFRRWLEERRQAKMRRLRDIEVEEEKRADDILGRLHEGGIECLSDDERALLERVSHRYRQRNSQ